MIYKDTKTENKIERDQHFLINIRVIKKMIHELDIKEGDKILEIGAGQGNITHELVKTKLPITAFEIDPRFHQFLEEIKKENPNLNLMMSNALKASWKECNKLVGNIPFSAAEAILQKSIEDRISLLSILVSDNLKNTFSSNSKLGLITNLFFKIKFVQEVEPESLSPKPKVQCWLIRLERREPANKIEQIIRDVLTKNAKTKNAITYSLMKSGFTKNQSKKMISVIDFSEEVLEKPVKKITAGIILKLKERLTKFDLSKLEK
jgi:16S rRNA A1518/A1519 N6-dimethyltransferase RsmA/KsgA/DIM1 with predicted DNA glycosylase/AP lyase activity